MAESVGRTLVVGRGSVHRLGLDARLDGSPLEVAHLLSEKPVSFLRILVAVKGDIAHTVERHLTIHEFGTVRVGE